MAPQKSPSIEDVYIRVGARIAELRAQRGFTQEQLAALADLSPNYIARTEGAYHRANLAKLETIGEALGVALAALFSSATPARTTELPTSVLNALGALARDDQQLVLQLARRLHRARSR